jgi:predicted Zn-dependent protease
MPSADSPLASPDEMMTRLDRVLAASPADTTELAWLEIRRGRESNAKYRRDTFQYRERTILVRVRQSGRVGYQRTEAADLSDLENAMRVALAQARLADPVPRERWPVPAPPGVLSTAEGAGLFDPEVARLNQAAVKEMVQRLADREVQVRIGWAEGRVAVANSAGLRRSAAATAVSIEVICGRGPGAGRAAAASRHLAALNPRGVVEQARRRQVSAGQEAGEAPDGLVPLILSQEAVARLLDLLNRYALSAASFLEGTSLLRGNLGNPVFSRTVSLRDDPTDPRGLPFPFDVMGWPTRRVDLIDEGIVLTPAVDERLALETGLAPTPHRVGPDESVATHLFLLPGGLPEEELMRTVGDGVWVGALDPIECFDAQALRFRAAARGVHSIAGGRQGAPLPDLVWEDSLASVLSRVRAIGADAVPIATREGFLGAITAPLLAVDAGDEVGDLRPLRE